MVETLEDEAPGGVAASTVKLSGSVTDSSATIPSAGVTTRAIRGSSAAVGDTVTAATTVLESTTVTGPSSPKGDPPIATSPPSEARVCPAIQCVLLP